MNIVQIEDFFHPDAGYQINILSKFMVKRGHDVTILTSEIKNAPKFLSSFFSMENLHGKDNEYSKKYGVRIIRVPTKRFISGRAQFKNIIFNTVESLKPDILYIHGNDTLIAIQYLLKLKKLGVPIVLDSHMLEMASVNKYKKIFRILYRKFITPIIIKNKIPVIRTQNDFYVEKYLGIPLSQSPWISVGTDTSIFYPDKNKRRIFRMENNIEENDLVFIYAGKLDETKGAKLLARAFSKKIDAKHNIVLIVVGTSNLEISSEIEEIFTLSENRILRFPTQKYIDLPKYYQASDIAIFPKQSSLSFYDVQASGLPTLMENNRINIDRLTSNNGLIFRSGDVLDFRQRICDFGNMTLDEIVTMKKNAVKYIKDGYDYFDITDRYLNIIYETYLRTYKQ